MLMPLRGRHVKSIFVCSAEKLLYRVFRHSGKTDHIRWECLRAEGTLRDTNEADIAHVSRLSDSSIALDADHDYLASSSRTLQETIDGPREAVWKMSEIETSDAASISASEWRAAESGQDSGSRSLAM